MAKNPQHPSFAYQELELVSQAKTQKVRILESLTSYAPVLISDIAVSSYAKQRSGRQLYYPSLALIIIIIILLLL